MEIYIVGGYVRDMILGVESKDIDRACVAESFDAMYYYIAGQVTQFGGKIFEVKPEYATVRAMIGRDISDFVLCRRDGNYSDGRRPDEIFAGTIWDDLFRRDFTCNGIAICSDGSFYDPFGGIQDIEARIIRCIGNTEDKIWQDAIRLLRAARFAKTKGFAIHPEIEALFSDKAMLNRMVKKVSQDRIRGEVGKMFKFDTIESIEFFGKYPEFSKSVFSGGIWLEATEKKRG